jgi:hypothetical protein
MGVVPNLDYNYVDSGSIGFPTEIVSPSVCLDEAVFSCQYVTGPFAKGSLGIDMCNFSYSSGGHASSASFDTTTGVYTFSSTNKVTFPLGMYHFKVTALIKDSHMDLSFTMTIIDECPQVNPQITDMQITGIYEYILQSDALVIDFDLSTMGSIAPSSLCGNPMIQFVTGSGSPNISPLAVPDYAAGTLTIGPSDDVTEAGDIYLRYKYYNE